MGASPYPTAGQEPPYIQGDYINTAPPKKKGVKKLLAIGIPAVLVLAVAVFVYFQYFNNASPALTVGKALGSLAEETSERIDGTPLRAVGMLMDTLEEGTIAVDFEYADYQQDVSGSFKLFTDTKERDYAVTADLKVAGQNIDIEAYMNKERIAMRSQLIDSSYYGFAYKTFSDDIRVFGNQIGLDNQTMSTLTNLVDMIDKMMNADEPDSTAFEGYSDLFADFIKNLDMKRGRAQVESGGASVSCTKIEVIITADELVGFLNDLYELFESDNAIIDQFKAFDTPLTQDVYEELISSYNQMLRELRASIRDMERNYEGEINISFYIGSKDRLLRLEVNEESTFSGDSNSMQATFDFGTSALDRWVANITSNNNGDRSSMRIVWDYSERSGNLEQVLTITQDSDDMVAIKSVWSPDRGNFTLSIGAGSDSIELTGVFTTRGEGFRLSLDDPNARNAGARFSFAITAEPGAQIKQIDYINLDKWGNTLIRKLEDFFASGIF